MAKRKKKWIRPAIKRPGALSKAAKRAGMSTLAYAKKILRQGRKKAGKVKWSQANLYVNVLRKLPKPSKTARKRGARKAVATKRRKGILKKAARKAARTRARKRR